MVSSGCTYTTPIASVGLTEQAWFKSRNFVVNSHLPSSKEQQPPVVVMYGEVILTKIAQEWIGCEWGQCY